MLWTQASAQHVATIGIALAIAGSAASQGPPVKRRPTIVVEVRDPSGQRVGDATGWLRLEPNHSLAALPAGIPESVLAGLPTTNAVTARSDARGIVRFRLPGPAAGSGMVTTKAGLGGLLPRIHSQRANRLMLQPLAEVTTDTGSETFTLVGRATMPDGSKITLPPQTGQQVRLPAGDYEIWAGSADGVIWERLRLRPGKRTDLKFSGPARRLQLAADAYVYPAGMPDLSLRQLAWRTTSPPRPGLLVLRGTALEAPLVSWHDGIVTPAQTAAATAAATELSPWPTASASQPRTTLVQLTDTAPEQTSLFGLVRADDRSYRVTAYAKNEAGALRMPARPDGDAWLLLTAPGHAATARPWPAAPIPERLAPTPGQDFALAAREQSGLPVVDLRVSFTPMDQEAAAITARTDDLGIARFGRVRGPGTLRVSDARYANQEIDLTLIPVEAMPLVVEAGETIHATAGFADGNLDKDTTIVVTLRDPSAELRPAHRSLVTTAGEPCRFAGLPNDRDLLLTATAQRGGKTWSARQAVKIDQGPIELTLHCEDPELRPGKD